MNHILIPCDFSLEAEEAVIFGISVARATQAEITVLYVIDMPTLAGSFTGMPVYIDSKVFETLEQTAAEKFQAYREKHGKDFEHIKLVVQEGQVTATINHYITAHKVDLVVMGTKGATGLKEFFVGSNTEKIVRLSPVPVFAVRKAAAFTGISNIVYPTSLDLNQTDFINRLKELQKLLNANLHLLYVNTPHCFMNEVDLEEFIQFYQLTNVSFSIRRAALEEDGILDFVAKEKTDLLVMATHGRKGLSHLFSGSIAEHIVNRIQCPIWTYALKKTIDDESAKREQAATAERLRRNLV